MSPSARRLASTVATDRFIWHDDDRVGDVTVPSRRLQAAAAASAITPSLRDLPVPAGDRTETIEREAYERGVADGRRAVEADAEARLADLGARLAGAVEQLTAVRGVLLRRSERDLVRLAIAMAERILRREVDVDRELLLVMARVAIDRLGDQVAASIRLNPVDHDVILSRHPADAAGAVELIADPSVPRCGAIVTSSFGTIDVSIDSQVRELSRALLGHDSRAEGDGDAVDA